MYRNSQTTSTKCQYHAEHSNPIIKSLFILRWFSRNREIAKNVDPMITCSPWNPVAMKNLDPYTESDMEKWASLYSSHCRNVNTTPRRMVENRA